MPRTECQQNNAWGFEFTHTHTHALSPPLSLTHTHRHTHSRDKIFVKLAHNKNHDRLKKKKIWFWGDTTTIFGLKWKKGKALWPTQWISFSGKIQQPFMKHETSLLVPFYGKFITQSYQNTPGWKSTIYRWNKHEILPKVTCEYSTVRERDGWSDVKKNMYMIIVVQTKPLFSFIR